MSMSLLNGFPPITLHCGSTTLNSIARNHQEATEIITIFDVIELPEPNLSISCIWGTYHQKKNKLNYSSETDISGYVKMALNDVIYSYCDSMDLELISEGNIDAETRPDI